MRANIRFCEDSRGLIETAGSKLCNDYFDFLGEYGAICKVALAREPGPYRGDCLMGKTESRKSRDTGPLRG
jgi:hypothetical protein